MKNNDSSNIVIAGGGTGGHLYPGIAIADEFVRQNRNNRILFINTGNAIENKILSKEPYRSLSIQSGKFLNQSLFNKIKSILTVSGSIFKASKELDNFKADAVIGVGGYVGVPVIIAAWLKKIPVFIQEQNSVPGISNKIFSFISKFNFVSFENTKLGPEKKKIFTGNPVRQIISENSRNHKDNKKFTVFITGGSQGAKAINQALIQSLDYIKQSENIQFIHQTGESQFDSIKKQYNNKKISCEVAPFFSNISDIYKKTDLIISRAGASTLAEISAAGIPAVFIPYPFATHNHQFHNCIEFQKKGAAIVIEEKDLSGKIIGKIINSFYEDRNMLYSMERIMKEQSNPDAASKIYKIIKRELQSYHV
ncbi:MAG: undecaprenyldiphospho-muramoylpentapeptide beta-N-acetylglucosaminyltransferase [Desulfobacteraceae bacterium]|nr:undecaprenyldiphospho-muramoylpentapeptide beta-N-acetylglucosaminyltransferase [Desulfobacteraceae bacterium]MCB9494507.1 undecaprenyldiphospho-muramoylpentapeptide beta-N-acetylglucosaminyltransferase [Desulfobacteraceae bacterium]